MKEPEQEPLRPLEIERPSGHARYRKVRSRAAGPPEREVAADEPLAAVVEVAEPGYRPAGLTVRADITDTMFTADVRPSALAGLDDDPRVVSIELGTGLNQID